MEITKGKWEVRNSIPQSSKRGDITVHTNQIITVGINAGLDLDFQAVSFCGRRGNEQAESNAILIADAGNTCQATNKLPSELAEANKELLEILTELVYQLAGEQECEDELENAYGITLAMRIKQAQRLIKKHSKNA